MKQTITLFGEDECSVSSEWHNCSRGRQKFSQNWGRGHITNVED